jgi:hypothetical protein
MSKIGSKLYDGKFFCGQCSSCNCPVVELHGDEVLIHDPDKPERGKLYVQVKEYQRLIAQLREIHSANLFVTARRVEFGMFTIERSENDSSNLIIRVPGELEISLTMMTVEEFVNLFTHAELA